MRLVPVHVDLSQFGRPFAFEHCYPANEEERKILWISPEGIACCDEKTGNWKLPLVWVENESRYRLGDASGAPLEIAIDVDAVFEDMDLLESRLIGLVRLVQSLA